MKQHELIILISGRGSNMQSILEKCPYSTMVISNNPDAPGIDIAKQYGVTTEILDHRKFPDRDSYENALSEIIQEPKLIALAGFMRILGKNFIEKYEGRIINIHPSLLPSFPGLNTHLQALKRGVKFHGCTVHYVTPELDDGPIITQAIVRVLPNDTEETLSARVLNQEHWIYPITINEIFCNLNQKE